MGYKRKDAFVDIWLFRQDFDLKDVRYQPGETCGAKCAKKEEILEMEQTGELVPFSYLEEFFRKIH